MQDYSEDCVVLDNQIKSQCGELFFSLFVFSMAISLKIFFYKKYSLAEYVAVAFYLIGAYTVFTTFNLFFMKYINSEIQYLGLLFMCLYFVFAAVSFFQNKRIYVALKALLAYVTATILYIIFGLGLSFIIVLLKAN